MSQGPVGAGGLRPLLGKGAAAARLGSLGKDDQRAPTFRVPGASVAARAAAAASGGQGSTGTAGSAAGPGAATPSTPTRGTNACGSTKVGHEVGGAEIDDEGFQVVRGSGWRRQRAAAAGNAGGDGATHDRGADAATADDDAGDDGATGTAGGTGEGPGDAEPTPTADDLHRAWLDEVAVVRKLRQQGLATDHPAMAVACATRDAAEARWRGAKEPVPTAIRLSRAQNRLDRAVSAQADTRTAMLELEKTHRAQMAELQSKLDDDTERVRQRRQQLREVQAEIAGDSDGVRGAAARQGAAVQQVHTAICRTVAPTIAALVEQLDSSLPAWGMLNGLLGTLTDSKNLLERAIAPQPEARTFDIGDEEVQRDGQTHGEEDSDAEWSESHELRDGPASQLHDTGGGAARGSTWQGHVQHGGSDGDGYQPMDTDEWWGGARDDWGAGVRWEACGHGKWARTRPSWADAWENEAAQEEDADTQRAATRRRLEPAPQATPGTAASADGDGTAHGEGDEERRKSHEARVQAVVEAAINAGVQPLTASGEDLVVLGPNQLAAWAEENLQSNGADW